jgi:uncharacterized protein YbjT (DUF2867 family)
MILVTGATGTAGSQVVRALMERRRRVRAFVRDCARARRLLGDGVDLAHGDFGDPHSFRAALEDVEELFLSGADDPGRVAWETEAIGAAVAAGVRRIVKLSSLVAEPGAPVAFWDWHGRIERHLRACGVPAVILRCSFFMSNVLAAADPVARGGRLYAPAGQARIAMIDPYDVGAAAAAVFTSEGHDGQTYVLTGPEAVTYGDVAARLSDATGRRVEFIDISDEDAMEGMVGAGMPAFIAQQVCAIYAQARAGGLARVTPTVEALTGRTPRDVAAFALHHARLFAPVALEAGR